MRTVTLNAHLPAADPAHVFDQLIRFDLYAGLVEPVRYINVEHVSDTELLTEWAVNFRKGVLHWTEREHLDRAAHTIRFVQEQGDFDFLEGGYTLTAADSGVDILFQATFDFGVSSIESIIEPIAARVLRENIALVLQGLLGPTLQVRPAELEEAAPSRHAVFDRGDARDIPGLAVSGTAKGAL